MWTADRRSVNNGRRRLPFTFILYGPAVAKDSERQVNALKKWREAEADYSAAIATYLDEVNGTPAMTKDELIDLVSLRDKADKWREKFFKRQGR